MSNAAQGELTKLGRRMAEFPLDPMLAKAILASEKYQVRRVSSLRLPCIIETPPDNVLALIMDCACAVQADIELLCRCQRRLRPSVQ